MSRSPRPLQSAAKGNIPLQTRDKAKNTGVSPMLFALPLLSSPSLRDGDEIGEMEIFVA